MKPDYEIADCFRLETERRSNMAVDGFEAVRTFYRALDDHEYETLGALLAPQFVHRRPDRTITGRERFVQFMREDRPDKQTTHSIEAVYRGEDGELAARGRLLDADGDEITAFVDVFVTGSAGFESLLTFTQ